MTDNNGKVWGASENGLKLLDIYKEKHNGRTR